MDSAGRRIRLHNRERLDPDLDRNLRALEKDRIVARIWDRDWTVWKGVDKEISNRLGWLASPVTAEDEAPDLEAFASSLRSEGLTRAVVLGMGGSSLAPEVFARLFATGPDSLELEVIDTTEPGTVAAAGTRLDLETTLFLVSSKSGTTAELLALLSFFYDLARRQLGEGRAGGHFVAVTDPGTPLEALAVSLGFRRTFLGRPAIGGRFSALSAFGLLPAALKGIDLRRLLASARTMASECRADLSADNPAAYLGAILGTAALKGLDKLTFLVPPRLGPLAGWLEQLIAESTGKEGRGIIPVIEHRPGPAGSCGKDGLFVDLGAPGEPAHGPGVRELVDAGQPLIRISLDDLHGLAGHFFLWEFATAVAAHLMEINPFDQPDVESTKKKTREVLAGPARSAVSSQPPSAEDGLRVVGPGPPERPADSLARFIGGAREGDYIAVLAFLPKNGETEGLLAGLADRLRLKTRLPVTLGFGPRYLHSTGQLHKGDGNKGLFLMLTEADMLQLPVPAVPGISRPAENFADLFRAQARGDGMALVERGRRVLALDLPAPVGAGLRTLTALLS